MTCSPWEVLFTPDGDGLWAGMGCGGENQGEGTGGGGGLFLNRGQKGCSVGIKSIARLVV